MRRVDSILALIGGIWGATSAVLLTGVRVANSGLLMIRADWLGNLAFLVVYLTPFVLSLIALRWARLAARSGVWLAAGVLALLASFTAFSGVTLVFLPAAPLLIVAGGLTFTRVEHSRALAVVSAAFLMLAVVAVGLIVLISPPGQGRCWQLLQPPEGAPRWESIPYSQQQSVDPSSGMIRVECTTDIISPAESIAALGLLAAGVGGVMLLRRRYPPHYPKAS